MKVRLICDERYHKYHDEDGNTYILRNDREVLRLEDRAVFTVNWPEDGTADIEADVYDN